MYEALNNVRIMSRASHRNTDKRRVNQVNENSKLKSKIYEMQRLYVQRKSAKLDRILDSLKEYMFQ